MLPFPRLFVILALAALHGLCWGLSAPALASIHRAPIVIKAKDIKEVARYPLDSYRLFRTGSDGEAIPIPFQIDEVNELGDYVLDLGNKPNLETGSGYFDDEDELSFMGDDVGAIQVPKKWPGNNSPRILFELRFKNPNTSGDQSGGHFRSEGAVYLGIYPRNPPPLAAKQYVVFSMDQHLIRTSRYEYHFDPKNYLVVDQINVRSADEGKNSRPIIRSSSFFMQADLRYFVTVRANHRSINSRLDAYKIGPIRSIVRVSFYYSFLRLNFEVGMYTEVSFFSNSVILPAVMYIPINGRRFFNDGSGFYYGFAFERSPDKYDLQTNIDRMMQREGRWFDFLRQRTPRERHYWASVLGDEHMFYLSLNLSESMVAEGNLPAYYMESADWQELAKRDPAAILPLGESPVNLALYFDLTRFREGEHEIAFQLYLENRRDPQLLESFRNLPSWQQNLRRVSF